MLIAVDRSVWKTTAEANTAKDAGCFSNRIIPVRNANVINNANMEYSWIADTAMPADICITQEKREAVLLRTVISLKGDKINIPIFMDNGTA